MTAIVYVATYLGLLIFVAGCIRRILQYARTPMHLRWELYPVPHEEPGRAAHGGSYFETTDWWSQPSHYSLWGELRAMLPEMLFLKGLWEANRGLWYASFLFHFGLYCSIGSALLLLGAAAMRLVSPALSAGLLGLLWVQACHWAGYVGGACVLLGAAALLIRRLCDKELKGYTTAADKFNLLFFLVAFGTVSAGYVLRPGDVSVTRLVRGLLTFDRAVPIGNGLGAGLVMMAILAAYIPFTHMSHFIAKYFTYHAVRWDDAPNRRGSKIEARIAEYLTYRPTWAASHLAADGKKTWAQIATANPTEGKEPRK